MNDTFQSPLCPIWKALQHLCSGHLHCPTQLFCFGKLLGQFVLRLLYLLDVLLNQVAGRISGNGIGYSHFSRTKALEVVLPTIEAYTWQVKSANAWNASLVHCSCTNFLTLRLGTHSLPTANTMDPETLWLMYFLPGCLHLLTDAKSHFIAAMLLLPSTVFVPHFSWGNYVVLVLAQTCLP